jgi:hypothetical protein
LVGTGTKQYGGPEAVGFANCNQLFAVEKKAEQMTPEDRHELRQKESKPIVEAFYRWVEVCWANTLPQSLLGKVFAQNQQKYLLAFLVDGRIELSSNRAERSIKPFVIGKKNWLFCNTPGGAKSSAAIYSLIQTAIENCFNPQAYLEYVFKQLQHRNDIDVEKLLPWAAEIPIGCKMPVKKS